MYTYMVSGKDYDSIAVDSMCRLDTIKTWQYFMKGSRVVDTRTSVFYLVAIENKMFLSGIDTDVEDTLILPKEGFSGIIPHAMLGVKFKRLIVPYDLKLKLYDKALYGSDTLEEYVSLSNRVRYDGDVFPPTLTRRSV